jgi:hypothetical protein
MKQSIVLTLLAIVLQSCGFAQETAGQLQIPRSGALAEVNLASETEWSLAIDGGAARPIKVPAGGYASELQEPRIAARDVQDSVTYERRITIPDRQPGQATYLEFGAVNYAYDLFLDGTLVGSTTNTPSLMLPSRMDLTAHVRPGQSYRLGVKVYNKQHFGPAATPMSFDMQKPTLGWTEKDWHWWIPREGHFNEQGITRWIKLAIYPPVFIEQLFIKPSVKTDTLSFDVWIKNHTDSPQTIAVQAGLSPWKRQNWPYPVLPAVKAELPAQATVKVSVGPIKWGLGEASYWWPNIPFREDYTAQLHYLNVQLLEKGKMLARRTQRFGFVEHAEGPAHPVSKSPWYYSVNGVRVTGIGDGTPENVMANGAYSLKEGFLSGCAETWKRYMRLGINILRPQNSIVTEHMLDTADELGFMFEAESTFDGQVSCTKNITSATYENTMRAMAEHYRNHPSVARYSLYNEWFPPQGTGALILDTLLEHDATRPVMTEGYAGVQTAKGHATCGVHYPRCPAEPCTNLYVIGEHHYDFNRANAATFCALWDKWYRYYDVAHTAGWCWINFWPNLIQGARLSDHNCRVLVDARKAKALPDKVDGVDGWNSPVAAFIQRCHAPYLVMELQTEFVNWHDEPVWPRTVMQAAPGEALTREIELFNGGLSGDRMSLRWTLRWDSAAGQVVQSETVNDIRIAPGFHAMQPIRFTVPEPGQDGRKLYLILESLKDGTVVYTEDRVHLLVNRSAVASSAQFLGIDTATQGDWPGKYGSEGCELVGQAAAKPPTYATVQWHAGISMMKESMTDRNALLAGESMTNRLAAARPLHLTVDVGDGYHEIALYVRVWSKYRKLGALVLRRPGGPVLDTQLLGECTEGQYLRWRVRGKVQFDLAPEETAPVVGGLFFDSPVQANADNRDPTKSEILGNALDRKAQLNFTHNPE